MGLLEFSKLPVNTLVGADWKTFKEMTKDQHITKDKRTKYIALIFMKLILHILRNFMKPEQSMECLLRFCRIIKMVVFREENLHLKKNPNQYG